MATVKRIKKTVDIADLFTADAHETGSEMRVKGPDGKFLDMYIMLRGIDSLTARQAINEVKRTIAKGGDREQAEVEAVVKFTLGWRGFMNGDKEWEFTEDHARQLYTKAPYIREQADLFVSERGNFTKG